MSKQGFKIIGLFLGLVLMINTGCAQKANSDMEKLIKDGAFLVDVRTPEEFSGGHVPGSVNIPLSDIEKELAQFKDKDQIVVFCRSGARSGQALQILNKNGFTNVSNGGTWTQVNQYVSP
jgi:phage shock protein E